ncbi:MAG: glycosyltransferase [Alphaproteobacteria bacterium]|nr:glycosyltransferase [Alphaproteobacteria bacterium]
MHIFVLQHGLRDYRSHYFVEALGWRRAFQHRNLTFTLHIHQDATPQTIEQSGGVPLFPFEPMKEMRQDPLADELHGFLYFSEAFRKACVALTDSVTADDIVIVPHATARELFGVAGWLRSLPKARRPRLAFVFINPGLRWEPIGETAQIKGNFSFHRFGANQLAEVLPPERVIYCADNHLLATTMAKVLNQPCSHSPMTIDYVADSAEVGESSDAAWPPAHIGVLGGFRPEKGSRLLVDIIRKYCAARPNREIFIQLQDAEHARIIGDALSDCGSTGINIFSGQLSPAGYAQRLQTLDILLLPYQRGRYIMRTSGIFAEAAANGIVTVVPGGSWMATQLAAGWGAGVTFDAFSVDAIADALVSASDDCATLKAKAQARRDEWRRTQSTPALLDHILAKLAPPTPD